MKVEAVLFDAGNTLVYAHPDRMAEIFRAQGVDVDGDTVAQAELEARRTLHDAIGDGHVGTEPEVWHHYFVALFRGSGVPEERMSAVGAAIREVHAKDHLWTRVASGTEEALQALLDGGLRLAVISNADGRMHAVLERCGLTPFMEFVVDSEVVGVEKPDPAIFHEACRRLELPPEACLYVGDLYRVDYLGATGAGMAGVLMDPLELHSDAVPTVGSLAELPAHVRALDAAHA